MLDTKNEQKWPLTETVSKETQSRVISFAAGRRWQFVTNSGGRLYILWACSILFCNKNLRFVNWAMPTDNSWWTLVMVVASFGLARFFSAEIFITTKNGLPHQRARWFAMTQQWVAWRTVLDAERNVRNCHCEPVLKLAWQSVLFSFGSKDFLVVS